MNRDSRKTVIIGVICALIVAVAAYIYYSRPAVVPNNEPIDESVMPSVEIGDHTAAFRFASTTFFLEIADDEVERQEGLSNRQGFEEHIDGMLFVLATSSKQSIWMKDMRFALDIIWLDQNWKVVDMAEHVSPNTYPRTFVPKANADYVIELMSGRAAEMGLKIGDEIKLLAWRP